MKFSRFFLIGIAAAIALFLCGCEEMPSRFQQAVAALPIPSGWWNDDGAHGPSRIVVHLTEQKAYFYKGKILVDESTVSTGKRGFSTPQVIIRSIPKTETIIRASLAITWIRKTMWSC